MHRGGILIVFLIITGISLLLDWYVFSGLKTLTNDWQSVRARQVVTFGYLTVSVGVIIVFVAGLSSFSTAKGMTPFHEWVLSIFLTFFFTKLFFLIVLFLGDIGRFFYGLVNNLAKPKGKVTRVGKDLMKKLQSKGFDPHDHKPQQGNTGGKIDLWKDDDGYLFFKAERSQNYEPTFENINQILN